MKVINKFTVSTKKEKRTKKERNGYCYSSFSFTSFCPASWVHPNVTSTYSGCWELFVLHDGLSSGEREVMNHKKAEKILSVFYDFELSEKEHLEVTEHVEVCKNCQFALKQFEGISAVFSRSEALQPAESFSNRFIEHLAHLEISVKKAGQRFSFLNDLFFPLAGYITVLSKTCR